MISRYLELILFSLRDIRKKISLKFHHIYSSNAAGVSSTFGLIRYDKKTLVVNCTTQRNATKRNRRFYVTSKRLYWGVEKNPVRIQSRTPRPIVKQTGEMTQFFSLFLARDFPRKFARSIFPWSIPLLLLSLLCLVSKVLERCVLNKPRHQLLQQINNALFNNYSTRARWIWDDREPTRRLAPSWL